MQELVRWISMARVGYEGVESLLGFQSFHPFSDG